MTREEKLYSMTMVSLVEVANKLGIKIDKKGAKSKAVAKILAAENAVTEEKPVETVAETEPVVETVAEPTVVEELTDEQYAEVGKEIAEQAKEKAKSARKPKTEKADHSAQKDAGRTVILEAFERDKVPYIVGDEYPYWIRIKTGKCTNMGIGLNDKKIRVRSKLALLPAKFAKDADSDKGSFDATLYFNYDELDKLIELAKIIASK